MVDVYWEVKTKPLVCVRGRSSTELGKMRNNTERVQYQISVGGVCGAWKGWRTALVEGRYFLMQATRELHETFSSGYVLRTNQ